MWTKVNGLANLIEGHLCSVPIFFSDNIHRWAKWDKKRKYLHRGIAVFDNKIVTDSRGKSIFFGDRASEKFTESILIVCRQYFYYCYSACKGRGLILLTVFCYVRRKWKYTKLCQSNQIYYNYNVRVTLCFMNYQDNSKHKVWTFSKKLRNVAHRKNYLKACKVIIFNPFSCSGPFTTHDPFSAPLAILIFVYLI